MVKPGYKQTEIGVIPEDWEVHSIQDVYLKARIGWQGLTTQEYQKTGDYYLVTGVNLNDNKINWQSCFYVEKDRYDQDKKIQLQENDLLVTKDGTIGKIAYIDILPKPATLNSGIFVLRPNKNLILPSYLFYVFQSKYFKKFIEDLTAGSTIVHLYQKDFIKFKYPVPDTDKQQKIAEALSDVDELIFSLEKLIEKYKSIKSACLQQMFPQKGEKVPQMRLPGFTDAWEQRKLGEVFETVTDYVAAGSFADLAENVVYRDTPNYAQLVRTTDLKNGFYSGSSVYVDKKAFDFLYRVNLDKECIILPNIGNCGEVYLVIPDDLPYKHNVLGPNAILVRSDTSDNAFLSILLQGKDFQEKLSLIISPNGQTKFNKTELKQISLNMPKQSEEQHQLGAYLKQPDNLITLHQRKLGKVKKIKEGMMQQLLTGKIRLV